MLTQEKRERHILSNVVATKAALRPIRSHMSPTIHWPRMAPIHTDQIKTYQRLTADESVGYAPTSKEFDTRVDTVDV